MRKRTPPLTHEQLRIGTWNVPQRCDIVEGEGGGSGTSDGAGIAAQIWGPAAQNNDREAHAPVDAVRGSGARAMQLRLHRDRAMARTPMSP